MKNPSLPKEDLHKIFNVKKITFRSDDEFGVTLPSRKDLSKSFAQLSLPNVLEFSTKTVDKSEESSTSTSSLVVIARTQIKAYTQFGPLQVNFKKSSLSKILQSSQIIKGFLFVCHCIYHYMIFFLPRVNQFWSRTFLKILTWRICGKFSLKIPGGFTSAPPIQKNQTGSDMWDLHRQGKYRLMRFTLKN